jgi:nitroreductase
MTTKTQSIAEVIRNRRSIKSGYLPTEVKEETVVSLLKDAAWAPNHGLREPWRFILVTEDRKEAYIDAVLAAYGADRHEAIRKGHVGVPAFLIAIMNEDPRQKIREENFAAVSCMLQNFQLLAWEQNLGTCWKTPNHILEPKFHAGLGVDKGEKVIGIIQLGYFDPEVPLKDRKRTPIEEKVTKF